MTELPADEAHDSHNHIDCLVNCGWPGCAAPPEEPSSRFEQPSYLQAGRSLGLDCIWRE